MAEVRLAELRRIGAGREAEVYALDEGRVLRLARTAALRSGVERERVALLAAGRCGAPAPAVFERLDVDGRPGLVLERLDAHDLLSGMVSRPWEIIVLPRVLAALHASLHEIVAPASFPSYTPSSRNACAQSSFRPTSRTRPSAHWSGFHEVSACATGTFIPAMC